MEINKILKTSIVIFSVLTIINCIGIMSSSNALFEKSVDTKNSINLRTKEGNGTEKLNNIAKSDTTNLVYDGTQDNNLRYIGANPDNYVMFNNELWRIIGVMNNVDDGTEKKESRIKIIRNSNFGNASTSNQVYSNSTLKSPVENFYTNNINEKSKAMVDNAVWNLGNIFDKDYNNDKNTFDAYNNERVGTTMISKIGLVYISDYGFATSGGTSTNRESCLNYTFNDWANNTNCATYNFLHVSDNWTMGTSTSSKTRIFRITDTSLYSDWTYYGNIGTLRPTVYLKSDVKITSGTGKSTDPYQLAL